MACEHDLGEMDTAAHFDGLCPICLKEKVERLQDALRWAMEYLESYDHAGTGPMPSAKDMREYDEKLETIRLMTGLPRQTRMKLSEHFNRSGRNQKNGGFTLDAYSTRSG